MNFYMIAGFYYLAAYTAAAAVGFSEKDCAGLAWAARYTGNCTGVTIPEQTGADPDLLRAVFHYLPGDAKQIQNQVRSGLSAEEGSRLPAALRLVCMPGGTLMDAVIQCAEQARTELLSEEQKHQRLGIVAHIILDACLHQGFAGVNDDLVNGATELKSAGTVEPERRRQLLERTQTEALAEVFQMKSVSQEPPVAAVGCGQVEPLINSPSAIFSYSSEWQKDLPVSCIMPIRCAGAYFVLRKVFQYIKDPRINWKSIHTDETSVLDLAAVLMGIPTEKALLVEWGEYFSWLGKDLSEQNPPPGSREKYLQNFQQQALKLWDVVMRSSPDLRAYQRLTEHTDSQNTRAPQQSAAKGGECIGR